MADPIEIEVKDFTPGPNLEAFAFEGFEAVLSTAPYGARVHALIELTPENAFHTIVKLDISSTRYIANVSDPDVTVCLTKAFAKMRADISRWRRDRAIKGNKKKQNEFEALELKRKQEKFHDGTSSDDDDGSKSGEG